eukprot:CAMPEP_0113669526 /NCGR_PEP_ID=MMETSP0038_2-20120614/4618_1 /TAXON_ID=2898 /ORGANISM="Cryptomonas paramecium" /LENGTH=206 /DNA_ID=CAMNT_0000585417 /DNA_START=609 /DNA_END=1226 /DNA_ORIENTATION=+ /assembly_acc=CAM_ASM_000170
MGYVDGEFLLPFWDDHLFLACLKTDLAQQYADSSYLLVPFVQVLDSPAECVCGPLNLGQIHTCVKKLDQLLKANPKLKIALCVEDKSDLLINAAFVLGCYLVIIEHQEPNDVWSEVSCLDSITDGFHDPNSNPDCDFCLSLLDCWTAIAQARSLGWLDRLDIREYAHYANPLEGDLHIVIPDELVLLQGPVALDDGADFRDDGLRR